MQKIADILNIVDIKNLPPKLSENIHIFLSEKLKISIFELKNSLDLEVSGVFFEKLKIDIQSIISGKPVYRVLGYRYFWKDRFLLSSDTLEPRSDTEILIETCLKYFPDQTAALQILDLGTGSGCILMSLLREYSRATGVGVDLAKGALQTAAASAEALGLANRAQWVQSNWLDKISESYDVIVSNPPYIPSENIKGLSEIVQRYDPMRALEGGEDGLGPYRMLEKQLPRVMRANSKVILEIGYDQSESVPQIFTSQGYQLEEVVQDYGKNPRCVVVSRA